MNNEVKTTKDVSTAGRPMRKKTAVGLFENPGSVESVVREIEALGFPRNEVRTLEEPERFEVTGVMSFPRLDFAANLNRALTTVGATEAEAEVYIKGLQQGGTLVFATGSSRDSKVDDAAQIMNRHGAVGVEGTRGSELDLPMAGTEGVTPSDKIREVHGLVGRIPPVGSAYFVW